MLDRVTSSISGDISVACGGRSASDDQRSASLVLNQYCEPDATVEFWTPTKNIVNAYITELSEMAWLPPCASDGLSSAVMQEVCDACSALSRILKLTGYLL